MNDQVDIIISAIDNIKRMAEAIKVMKNPMAKKIALCNIRKMSDDVLDAVDKMEDILGDGK